MLALLLTLTTALADEGEETVYLGQLGISAELPDGWSIPRWSDWDLEAVDAGKTTKVTVLSTAYQIPVDQDSAKVWAELPVQRLEDEEKGHAEITVVKSGVSEQGGTRVATAEVSYKYEGDKPASYYQWTFPVQGQVVHLSATAIGFNAPKAEQALPVWMDALTIEKPAEALPTERAVSAPGQGFGTTLPEGWRLPLKSELGEVRKLAAKTGQKVDPESCWLGFQPYADGTASVLLACQAGAWLGVVDEHSFAGVDEQLRTHELKSLELPAAEKVEHSDRLSFLYNIPPTENAIRMAVTPFDKGIVLTYALGPAARLEALDEGIHAALEAMSFEGPDNGAHPEGVGAWIQYAASYRPILLAGAAVPVLIFFGLIAVMANKKKPNYEDV